MTTAYSLLASAEHTYPGHPEEPARFSQLGDFHAKIYANSLVEITPIPATIEEITAIHDVRLIKGLEAACEQGPAIVDYAPTYVTQSSFQDALKAAGATLDCTRAVLSSEVKNAFAIIRPPGHHAEPERAMGFCLFNNIALAACLALDGGLSKILIVDFDAHHGNGTQAAFLHDDRVAYFSTHQEYIYPGTGYFEEAQHARGRIVNLPLPSQTGDTSFRMIAEEVFSRLVKHVRPEMIFVSAGFDSHWDDPLTSLGLSSGGFFNIAAHLVSYAEEYCDGRIVFALEGGYNPENVASGIEACLCALTDHKFDGNDPAPFPEPGIESRIDKLYKLHEI